MSTQTIVYIKMERSVEVEVPEVFLTDVASVECRNRQVKELACHLCIYCFQKSGEKRTVVSVLRVIQLLEEKLGSQILVQSVGEKDVFIQWGSGKREKQAAKPWKIALISLVTFCGSAFTLMAYHNDIEIHKIFEGTVKLVLPQKLQLGLMILEVAYSLGLGLGIIVFFNHVGKWKLSNDPTPIEVALRKYELDVDTTLMENADREGKEIDVK